ncbi:MAG: ABC transporter permease [Phycisphaerae bacterium]|nr:ABC transporter permease [Phycisphaerae bacterium]
MILKALLNIPAYRSAFTNLVSLLRQHRELTLEMTKRELTDRYAGQVLGTLWVLMHPLLLMGVYVFVFVAVMKIKIEGEGTFTLPRDYTAYLLSGLTVWLACQECLTKSATSISSQANLVKQVVFPIEILPVRSVLSTAVTQLVSMSFLLIYLLIRYQALPWTVLLLPVLLFFQVIQFIGLGMMLASVGVYLRDVKDVVTVFGVVNMYLMPVIYLPAMAPGPFKPILYINPFSYMIWCYQDAWYFGRFEHWYAWIVYPLFSLFMFMAGYRVFRRVRIFFGNVL